MDHQTNLEFILETPNEDEHQGIFNLYINSLKNYNELEEAVMNEPINNFSLDLSFIEGISSGSETPKTADRSCVDSYNTSYVNSSYKKKCYKCTDCVKVYKSKENLMLHVKNIHLKIKPYDCKYCTALFSHRNGNKFLILGKTYHERKFHTKYLPHKCDLCNSNFASKSALNYHKKSKHSKRSKFSSL